MVLGDEARRNRLRANGFYSQRSRRSSEVVEMVFEQTTPDGRTLVMTWLEQCGSWYAKYEDEGIVRQGNTAAEAIAAASGEPAETGWIAAVGRQLEIVLALEQQAA
jgi:hypothetical protein